MNANHAAEHPDDWDADSIAEAEKPTYEVGGGVVPRNIAHADARNRGIRSLYQNAIAAVIVGALAAIAIPLVGVQVDNLADAGWWITLCALAAQGGLASLGSYIQRRIEERANKNVAEFLT